MKNLTKIVCLFLALTTLLFLMTSCNQNKTDQPQSNTPTQIDEPNDPIESTDATETPDDGDTSSGDGAIDDNGFFKGVKALDYIELFDYMALPIPNDIHDITDSELQSEIDYILADFPNSTQITDRAVAYGDTVNIDFLGTIDGEAFEGGSTDGMGTEVIIGETQFIDDFLDQLVDHMPGDTVNVEVTFPDDYQKESLQGKDALFVTEINYIVSVEVATELTDEFVMTNMFSMYGWTTADEMYKGLKEELQKYAIQQYIREYATKEVVVKSIPNSMIEYQQGVMMSYFQDAAAQYGMEMEDYLANSQGINSVDELIETYADFNKESVTYFLVLQAVAEDAGIIVSTTDIEDYYTKYYGSSDYSMYEMQYGMPYLKHMVLVQKAIDLITDNAIMM